MSTESGSMEIQIAAAADDSALQITTLGEFETKACRICLQDGTLIELGCSCKNDLAAAHKECAETWFKVRGNKTCEICGSIAQNVDVQIPQITDVQVPVDVQVPRFQNGCVGNILAFFGLGVSFMLLVWLIIHHMSS